MYTSPFRNASPLPSLTAVKLPYDLLVLIALLITNCALAVLWPSPFTALAALLLFIAMVSRMFVLSPGTAVLLLPFVLIYISSLISMNAIEAGGHMKEIGRYGNASPASALFAFFTSCFLLVAMAVHLRRLQRKPFKPMAAAGDGAPRSFLVAWGAVAIVWCAIAYLTLAGLRSGFPLLSGTDRMEYRRLSADVLTTNFLNVKFLFAAMLGTGAAFAATSLQRYCHHVTFVAYLLLSFLFGDKFFIVLVSAAFFSMPLLIKSPVTIVRQIRRYSPIALLLVACVFAVTIFIYSDYGTKSLDVAITKVGERVAGQGQLWFAAVEDSSHWVGFDGRTVMLNYRNLFANPAADFAFDHRIAAFYFVEHYFPSAMYHSVLTNEGRVTPTLVFEAYALVTFGYLGLVAVLLAMAMLTGMLITWLARSLMTGNPFNVMLPAFVCSQLVIVMTQATFYSLIGLSAFKQYAAFLVLQLVMAELTKPRRWLQQGQVA